MKLKYPSKKYSLKTEIFCKLFLCTGLAKTVTRFPFPKAASVNVFHMNFCNPLNGVNSVKKEYIKELDIKVFPESEAVKGVMSRERYLLRL
jgi:hypothetical protein